MTLSIAIQTNRLTLGLRLEERGGEMILLFILAALLVALVGLVFDFLILHTGGWLALAFVLIAIGMLLMTGIIEKASRDDDRRR